MKKISQHRAAKKHEETWRDGDRVYLVGVKRGTMRSEGISLHVAVREVDSDGNAVCVAGVPVEWSEAVSVRGRGIPEDVAGCIGGIMKDARERALREVTARRRSLEAWQLIPEGDE